MSDLWSPSRNHEIFWWNQDELGERNGVNYFLRKHLYFHTFFTKYFIIFDNISINVNTVLYEKLSWKHKYMNVSSEMISTQFDMIVKSTYVSLLQYVQFPPKSISIHLIIIHWFTFHKMFYFCVSFKKANLK